MTFSQPSQGGQGGDSFEAKEHRGHLLLVYPKVYHPEVQTKNGPSTAADVDIIIVDKFGPDGKPLSFINARLFGNLANSVRNDVGGQVLGRLDQISTQGGRTPWVLSNFNDQDAAAAGPVHAAYQQGQFRPTPNPMAAAAPPSAPAAPAWNSPAPAPAQQQWNAAPTPAPAPTPAAAPQAWQQTPAAPAAQWNAPAAAPAPVPPPAAAAPVNPPDPGLVQALQAKGINLPPGASHDDALAIWNSLG